MNIWIILVMIRMTGFASNADRNAEEFYNNEVDFHELIIINKFGGGYGGFIEERILKFKNNKGKVYGQILKPEYKVGGKVREPKKVLLKNSDVIFIGLFLEKVRANRDTCYQEPQTVVDDYTVILDMDTVDIKGLCNWGIYSYDRIEQTIFKEFFESIEQERLEFENDILDKLGGKWYVETATKR